MSTAVVKDVKSHLRRLAAGVVVAALATTGLVMGVATPASAASGPAPIEQRSESTVTADALPTVQIDSGIVWTQVIAGNTVFAGGSFSNARPAGANPGQSLMPRSNILAYNIDTGVATSFAPTINGTVYSLEVSPDGNTLYVGGSFTQVNGQTRFNIAAFNVSTGALLTTFKPAIGGSYVNAIVATNSTVYVGGLIGAAAGVTRKNLAAVSASNGALLGWAPVTDRQVDTMVMDPSGDKLIVGGRFSTVNDVSQRGLAALDLTTGAILPWEAPATVKNGWGEGTNAGKAGIYALTADDSAVYGTGWVFANKIVGNLEGMFAAEAGTGQIRWIADCHGDHYGIYSDGTTVYTTNHEHDCQTAGGLPQSDPATDNLRHATAWTSAAKGTLTTSPYVNDIYADWGGYPAPAAVDWFPDWVTGTASGQGQAGWTATGNGEYLIVGGEFPYVNGQRSQGIARFSNNPSTGAKQGPRLSGVDWTPTARSVSAGSARVTISANWDRDDLNLSYELWEQGGAAPIATVQKQSTHWNKPALSLTATGLVAGSTHTYRVVARDGDGNSANSAWVTVTVSSAAASDYANAVLDDGASLLWRLGGTDGGSDWAGVNNATFGTGAGTTTDGAIATEQNGAATFSGNSTGLAATTTQAAVGSEYAVELWFKTDTTTGGKLVGYGNAASGNSGSYDRHVYMSNNGRLTFGVYPNRVASVQSATAYNDNKWHHLVAQQDENGIQLYVDGTLVGSDTSALGAQTYSGYWRIGGDNLGGWPNSPSSSYFRGSIDEFAVYGTALSTTQIAEHVQLGVGPHLAPVAAVTTETVGLTATFSGTGSTASGGAAVSSYSWDFGDGSTSTEKTPTHRFAAAGTYNISLVVTDSLGSASAAATTALTVGAPTGAADQYAQRVMDDGAALYWRLGGNLAGLDWVGSNDAVLQPGATTSADDVFSGTTNGSTRFDGTTNGYARTNATATANQPLAAEIWFKTSTTSGGKLLGFGNAATGNSSSYDRHLYMKNNGQLVFGTWFGGSKIIETSASYNDDQWHHAVAQIGVNGGQLFIDGVLVGSNADLKNSEFSTGYWGIGGDNLGGWPSQPASGYFNGQLDEFAVYGRTLGAVEVQDHYLIAKGVATPTAQITVSGSEMSRDFDASTSTAPPGRTITGYAWDFGDGVTASVAAASHTYAEPGTYTVTLTVTDSAGRTGVTTSTVVASPPHAAPVAQIGSETSGLTVAFDADGTTTSGGATLTAYAWDFGDGTTSTQAAPSHSYTAAGTYVVSLIVTDSTGTPSAVASTSVTVTHADPTAAFTNETTGLGVSVDASGSAASDGATLAYSWNWGDATPAGAGKTASHSYAAAGTYTVTLTVTDSLGATSTKATPVTVTHADPVASFTATGSQLAVSVDATASTASDGATLSYSWNWGDGSPASSGASASHTYGAAGTFEITLTVTDSLGSTDDLTKEITLTSETVVARDDFQRSVASGWGAAQIGGNWSSLTGLSVSGGLGRISLNAGQTKAPVLSTASGADVTGTLAISADKLANGGGLHFNYVLHKSSAGEYRLKVRTLSTGTVTTSLTRLVGSTETTLATRTMPGYTYVAGAKLQVAFETSVTGGVTTLRGKVWADGTTEPGAWQLSATDSTASLQGAGQVGVLAYLSGSTTNTPVVVSIDDLRVTGLGGGEAHTAPVAVIGANASGLTTAFTGSGSTATGGATVTGYAWSFGDGATSTEASPAHAYAAAGTYTVTLTVTDSLGATSTADTISVTVSHANPIAAFSASASGLALAVNASGSSASDGATLSYAWNWGDGTPAGSGATVSHTYSAAGTYTVALTVTDSMGASATTSQSVSVSVSEVSFVAKDDFERVLASGWGSATTGGAWGTTAGFSVADGVGKATLTAGQTRTNLLTGVSAQNVDARLLFSTDKVANGGGLHFNYAVHKTTAGDYRLKLRIASSGVVQVSIAKVVGTTETIIVNRTLTGYTHTAGGKLQLRLQAVTTGGTTTLTAKAWADGTTEPADWFVSATDAQAEIQAAGQVGVIAYLSGSSTNAPVTVNIDNLEVR